MYPLSKEQQSFVQAVLVQALCFRVDDSSRLGCCRAVMPVLSLFLAGAVDLGNCHMLFYHLFKWPSTCLNPARVFAIVGAIETEVCLPDLAQRFRHPEWLNAASIDRLHSGSSAPCAVSGVNQVSATCRFSLISVNT
jgi:hypothetical protein